MTMGSFALYHYFGFSRIGLHPLIPERQIFKTEIQIIPQHGKGS